MSNKHIFFTFFITFSIISSQPTFTDHTISTSADGAYSVHAADVDGDGVMDVLKDHQTAGHRSAQWNGTNNAGQPVSAGLYLYTISCNLFTIH